MRDKHQLISQLFRQLIAKRFVPQAQFLYEGFEFGQQTAFRLICEKNCGAFVDDEMVPDVVCEFTEVGNFQESRNSGNELFLEW